MLKLTNLNPFLFISIMRSLVIKEKVKNKKIVYANNNKFIIIIYCIFFLS